MPVQRRRFLRKTRKRRNYRKKRIMRPTKTIANQIVRMKRFTTLPTYGWSVSAGSALTSGPSTDGVWTFTTPASIGSSFLSFSLYHTLGDVPNVSEFVSLFDSYKITGVKVQFILLANSVATGDASSATDTSAVIHHNYDFDDGNPYSASYAGIQDMQQCAYYRLTQGWKSVTKFYKPRVKTTMAVLSGATEVGNPRAMFIDLANTGVPHFGCKFMLQVYNSTMQAQPWRFQTLCTYYIKLKSIR